MGRRKIEDEEDARRCLRAAERAGQAVGEWSRAHGVDGRSLHAWEVNLGRGRRGDSPRRRRTKSAASAHEIVEIVPAGPAASRGRYVLEAGGARVEFDDDASAATLRRVLEVLRSC